MTKKNITLRDDENQMSARIEDVDGDVKIILIDKKQGCAADVPSGNKIFDALLAAAKNLGQPVKEGEKAIAYDLTVIEQSSGTLGNLFGTSFSANTTSGKAVVDLVQYRKNISCTPPR